MASVSLVSESFFPSCHSPLATRASALKHAHEIEPRPTRANACARRIKEGGKKKGGRKEKRRAERRASEKKEGKPTLLPCFS